MNTSLLTLSEAAENLRVSVRTLERESADGRLAIVRVRSRRMVEPAELDRYIAAQRACPSAEKVIAGKSESVLEAVRALSAAYRLPPPAPTRSRSKMRSGADKSRLRLAVSRAD